MKCRISPLKAVTGLALENLTGLEHQKGWKRGADCVAVAEQIFPLTRRWVSLRCSSCTWRECAERWCRHREGSTGFSANLAASTRCCNEWHRCIVHSAMHVRRQFTLHFDAGCFIVEVSRLFFFFFNGFIIHLCLSRVVVLVEEANETKQWSP